MTSIRSRLLSGAALSLLLAAGTAHAEGFGPFGDSRPLLLAQAEAEPPAETGPMVELDPVAAAEKAVEDARAALREAMATGGDVRGARRNLQTVIRQLNEVREAAGLEPIESGGSDTEAAEAPPTDTPPPETSTTEAPPPELPTLAVPETPPAELPTLGSPETPPAEPPMLAVPEVPPAELPTLALPEPPAAPPPVEPPAPAEIPTLALPDTAPPTLPPASEAGAPPDLAVQDTPTLAPPSVETPPAEPPAETAVVEPPTPPEAEAEEPGFFKRLFGGGREKPATTEEAAAPPADTLPIFKELPPLEGPKIVTVAPGEAEVVKQEDEKRVIVRQGGQITIKHDDNDRFRRKGEDIKVEKGQGSTTVTTVTRDDGTQVVTVRDARGDILQRYRKKKNGEVEVLIGERDRQGRPRQGQAGKGPGPGPRKDFDFSKSLPKLVIQIPQQQYIVGSQGASRAQIEAALIAPPVEIVERPYSLDEIRGSERLRAKLRRIDVDTVNFEFGAATIAQDQVPNLQAIGNALASIIASDPSEVFLIEGHTDAVGSDLANLALSDRRAESIAEILTYYFNIPPENLITQGYGEQYLKVLTAGPERLNRRAGVRRITPLLVGQL